MNPARGFDGVRVATDTGIKPRYQGYLESAETPGELLRRFRRYKASVGKNIATHHPSVSLG